jgi:hypothetical protein
MGPHLADLAAALHSCGYKRKVIRYTCALLIGLAFGFTNMAIRWTACRRGSATARLAVTSSAQPLQVTHTTTGRTSRWQNSQADDSLCSKNKCLMTCEK